MLTIENHLRSISEELLFTAFEVLQRIDNEESAGLISPRVSYTALTYDRINTRIIEVLQQAERGQVVTVASRKLMVSFGIPSVEENFTSIVPQDPRMGEDIFTTVAPQQVLREVQSPEKVYSDTFVNRYLDGFGESSQEKLK
ncbi:MAG: hypothetical protein PHY80_06620 [Rickettsiales bacterium]|nr:hypothetical protein [Rickettsiales bacterium]